MSRRGRRSLPRVFRGCSLRGFSNARRRGRAPGKRKETGTPGAGTSTGARGLRDVGAVCSGRGQGRRRRLSLTSRQQLLRVHVRLLDRVAYPVVRVADDEQPVLAVDQYAAAAAQYRLPAALDVLAREHDLVVRLHEHRDQHQRAAQHQTVREQRHGSVHERGGHVYPTVYVVRQVAHALQSDVIIIYNIPL